MKTRETFSGKNITRKFHWSAKLKKVFKTNLKEYIKQNKDTNLFEYMVDKQLSCSLANYILRHRLQPFHR